MGISRVADKGEPFIDGDLAGENGRASAMTFLEDFAEVTTGAPTMPSITCIRRYPFSAAP